MSMIADMWRQAGRFETADYLDERDRQIEQLRKDHYRNKYERMLPIREKHKTRRTLIAIVRTELLTARIAEEQRRHDIWHAWYFTHDCPSCSFPYDGCSECRYGRITPEPQFEPLPKSNTWTRYCQGEYRYLLRPAIS